MGYGIKVKSKLVDKVDRDWHNIAHHRIAREKIVRAYIGDAHGLSTEGGNRVPLNGHALYARSLILYLAAHQPRLNITTNVGPWKRHMEAIGVQASRVMREERFGFKQQRWVLDALVYSPGVIKCAQEWRTVPIGDEGDTTQVLKTFVENVDGSDWGFDTAGTSVWNCDYTFHRVRLPYEDIVDNPMFAKVNKDELRGCSGWEIGDSERLFFENTDRYDPYREMVTCWEIYERCTNKLCIYPIQNTNLVLYDEPWEGHRNGPFHYIDYLDIPNHVVGLSPLCIIHDLIEASNRALSKSIKQTDWAKAIMLITGGNEDEAKALMEAMDGQGVFKHGGGMAEIMNVPGPDRATLAMVPVLKDLFNWTGGNINELAGLGVSAPTATQGEMLHQAASGMVKFMQARTQEAVTGLAEAIVHNELKDEVNTEVIAKPLADGSVYWKRFTPEQRNAIDSLLVDVGIDVYSMRYFTPEERLGVLRDWWQNFAMPSAQMFQQDGGTYDIQKFHKIWAKYSDCPEINDIAMYSVQSLDEMHGSSGPVPMKQSPVTTRTNIRKDSNPGRDNQLGGGMAQALMSAA